MGNSISDSLFYLYIGNLPSHLRSSAITGTIDQLQEQSRRQQPSHIDHSPMTRSGLYFIIIAMTQSIPMNILMTLVSYHLSGCFDSGEDDYHSIVDMVEDVGGQGYLSSQLLVSVKSV